MLQSNADCTALKTCTLAGCHFFKYPCRVLQYTPLQMKMASHISFSIRAECFQYFNHFVPASHPKQHFQPILPLFMRTTPINNQLIAATDNNYNHRPICYLHNSGSLPPNRKHSPDNEKQPPRKRQNRQRLQRNRPRMRLRIHILYNLRSL